MNPLNPLFAVIIFLLAYLTGYLIHLKYKTNYTTTRYQTIDGLRGFLALAVFVHHSNIWYQYLHVGNWEAPKSNLYNQFGLTSVSLFFMITSFLFITKLINSNEKDFNWRYFFMSRILRLAPVYYFSVIIIFLCVMEISNWHLKVDTINFIKSIFNWGTFQITEYSVKSTSINNYDSARLIAAGVVWSLPFEWLFYFSLPLISFFILKRKPSIFYLLISLIFVFGFYIYHGIEMQHVLSFAGGAIAPFLKKYTSLKTENALSSILVLICLFMIAQFYTDDAILPKVLISVVFTIIAMGNTMFGVLKNSTLKFLGDICYSTYLLHGIVLFMVMNFILGIDKIKSFTANEYCMVIFLITPLIVVISFVTFKFIEKPFMDISQRIKDNDIL